MLQKKTLAEGESEKLSDTVKAEPLIDALDYTLVEKKAETLSDSLAILKSETLDDALAETLAEA